MIRTIKNWFINFFRKFKIAIVSLVVILSIFLGTNFTIQQNYHNKQEQLFTSKIIDIVQYIKKKDFHNAKKKLKEINVKSLNENNKYLVYFLKHSFGENIKYNYLNSDIEYDDTSIFGIVLTNQHFSDLLAKKSYKKIIHKYLHNSLQFTPEVVPFICYLSSISELYGKENMFFSFWKHFSINDSRAQNVAFNWFKSALKNTKQVVNE